MARSFRISLRFDERGVTVRNYFRTWSFGWGEVGAVGWDEFDLAAEGGAPTIAFRLRDGSTITAQAAWGLPPEQREWLVTELHAAGETNGFSCHVSARDLAFLRSRRSENPPLDRIEGITPARDRPYPFFRDHPAVAWLLVGIGFAGFFLLMVLLSRLGS